MFRKNKQTRRDDQKMLWPEILRFSRTKYGLAMMLLIVGLLGLALPVIPGLLLILLAIALLRPGLAERMRRRFKK